MLDLPFQSRRNVKKDIPRNYVPPQKYRLSRQICIYHHCVRAHQLGVMSIDKTTNDVLIPNRCFCPSCRPNHDVAACPLPSGTSGYSREAVAVVWRRAKEEVVISIICGHLWPSYGLLTLADHIIDVELFWVDSSLLV